MARNLPTIGNPSQMSQYLANWQQKLKNVGVRATPPPIPVNWSVTGQRGGFKLVWSATAGADGYEIVRSASGNFSDATIIPIKNPQQTEYFDSVGSGVATYTYKIHATSGTDNAPQTMRGRDSGPIRTSSLDATNTTVSPVTKYDTVTTDQSQASARYGNYHDYKSRNRTASNRANSTE